jgi:hypothetical protein
MAAEAHAIRTEFPLYNIAGALPVGLTDPTSAAVHDERLAELVAISQRRQEQKIELAELRKEERAAILAAMATGTKQVQICAITGFTREYVRRIERGAVSPTVEQQERA